MRASPTFAAALVLALLAGCSSSPGENSYATPAVANVRLTKAQRSHIQLYTVVPLGYRQTIEAPGAVASANARRVAAADRDLAAHNGISEREAAQAQTDAASAEADRVAALQALA